MDALKKVKDDRHSEQQSTETGSKVVAEIRVNIVEDPRQEFLEEYHSCRLCGTELEFTHVTNFIQKETVEEAYCPHCNVRNRKEIHVLQ